MASKFLGKFTASLQTMVAKASGKQLMGKDLFGNKYFTDPNSPRRRWVEYPNQDILGDTHTVPMSWHAWLRHGRSTPPTNEEQEKEEYSKKAMAARVAQINAADAKLRLQEMSEKHLSGQSSAASSSMEASAEYVTNMMKERDQHGDVSRWNQTPKKK